MIVHFWEIQKCALCVLQILFCYTHDLEVVKTLHTSNGFFWKSILEILSQIVLRGIPPKAPKLPWCLKIKGPTFFWNKIVKNHEIKNKILSKCVKSSSRMIPHAYPATSGRISKKITLQNWCNFCGVAYMGRKRQFTTNFENAKIKGPRFFWNKIVKNHEIKNFCYQSLSNHPSEWFHIHIRPSRPLPAIFGRISKIFLFKIGVNSAVCIYV